MRRALISVARKRGSRVFLSSENKGVHTSGQVDHDLGNRVPHLTLGEAVQDLYSTDPTKENCPTVDHAD